MIVSSYLSHPPFEWKRVNGREFMFYYKQNHSIAKPREINFGVVTGGNVQDYEIVCRFIIIIGASVYE